MSALLQLRDSRGHFSDNSRKLDLMVKSRKEFRGTFFNLDGEAVRNDASAPLGILFRKLLKDVTTACDNIRSAMSEAFHGGSPGPSALLEALEHAIEVYKDLNYWPKTSSVQWRYKSHTAPKDVQASGISQVFLFGSVHHGTVWQTYFCHQIQLCQSLLQGYTFLKEQGHPRLTPALSSLLEDDLRTALTATVDDICSCMPFLLSDIDMAGNSDRSSTNSKALGAFRAMQGVAVSNAVEGLSQRQRRLLLHLLDRIGGQFGIRLAWTIRDGWIARHAAEAEQLGRSLKIGSRGF
jgi:hypothetical protein